MTAKDLLTVDNEVVVSPCALQLSISIRYFHILMYYVNNMSPTGPLRFWISYLSPGYIEALTLHYKRDKNYKEQD